MNNLRILALLAFCFVAEIYSAEANTKPESTVDSLRKQMIKQAKPYLESISWITDLVQKDTAKSIRTKSLAPLAEIDLSWMQKANCSRKVPMEWTQYWNGLREDPSYDILPYYFFHNNRISYIFGCMTKDSIALLLAMMDFDTTFIVINKIGYRRGENFLHLYHLSKEYHFEPRPVTLYQREDLKRQESLPSYLRGKYFRYDNKNGAKSELKAVINDSMVYALNRWWQIQIQGEITIKNKRAYRIYATDVKTNRPGYFILEEIGFGGRLWTLSLAIEQKQNAYPIQIGDKALYDPFKPLYTGWRVIAITINFLLIISALAIAYRYFTRHRRRQQKRTQITLTGLRAQLNPHFLFNTLTSIQDLMNQDNKPAANHYFNEMAQLLRYVVDSSIDEYTNLASELAALQKYCALEALRTPFTYSFDIRPEIDAHNVEIPTMLLQPFVENAILHGLRPAEGIKDLKITMWLEGEDRIGVSIVDTGIGIEAGVEGHQYLSVKRSHQGINTTKKRIELLNQGQKQKITLKMEDRKNLKPNQTGTLVQLSIPI